MIERSTNKKFVPTKSSFFRNGSNKNSNSVQLTNILRPLLFTKSTIVESGNCSNLDTPEDEIIDFRSEYCNISNTGEIPEDGIEQYPIHLYNNNSSYYVKKNLNYIDGYIVRSIIKIIVC